MNPFAFWFTAGKRIPEFVSIGWVMLEDNSVAVLLSDDSRWDGPTPSVCINSLAGMRCVAGGGWDSENQAHSSSLSPCLSAIAALRSMRDSGSLNFINIPALSACAHYHVAKRHRAVWWPTSRNKFLHLQFILNFPHVWSTFWRARRSSGAWTPDTSGEIWVGCSE